MASQEIVLNGRYKLISQQASGGMAVVYKALDLQLMRSVAVKVLRPSLTGDAAFLARFRQEALNVANLSHPNIVTVHDFQQDGSTYYIVMEWIEGQDLKKLIRASAPFTVERALTIAIQICAGIGYAHRAGLVHADVKPQNILVTADDHVKVTDFGIAQAALSMTQAQAQGKQSVVWGSPHYFAPEQATGETPTTASDVYSIGIVLFEMLTGKLPYVGNDQQELALAHIRDAVPHAMEYNPRVPLHLDRIIFKVMAKDPAQRYRTADQLGRVLIAYKQQGTDPTIDQPALSSSALSGPQSPSAPPAAFPQAPAPAQNTPSPAAPQPAAFSPAQRPGAPIIPPASQAYPQSNRPAGMPPRTGATGPQPAVQANVPNALSGSPVPQQPYVPPAAYPPIQKGYSAPLQTSQPVVPSIPPGPSYAPVAQSYSPQPYSPLDPYASAPDANLNSRRPGGPNYQVDAPPAAIDLVTIVLGVIAFVAIIGLIPLWLAVLNAYARGG